MMCYNISVTYFIKHNLNISQKFLIYFDIAQRLMIYFSFYQQGMPQDQESFLQVHTLFIHAVECEPELFLYM